MKFTKAQLEDDAFEAKLIEGRYILAQREYFYQKGLKIFINADGSRAILHDREEWERSKATNKEEFIKFLANSYWNQKRDHKNKTASQKVAWIISKEAEIKEEMHGLT